MNRLIEYVIALSISSILVYMIGYNSGYNRGYSAAQCSNLTFSDQIKCWKDLE